MFPNVRGKRLKSIRQYFKYSFSKTRVEVDILHFSVPRFYPFFWLFPSKKFACTFHAAGDVTSYKDKIIISRELYNLTAKLFYRKLDLIIAVSEQGKLEISKSYKIPHKLIKVMYPGTDDVWNLPVLNKREYKNYGRKIITVLGRWQVYKNIQTVSKALVNATKSELENYYFVFVGKKITANSNIIEKDLAQLDPSIFETIDFLANDDYVDLIKHSDLVIVPSLNEGFSLPIFDAFSLGTRVMFHSTSPAAQILLGKKGVFACDLSNPQNFLLSLSEALELETGSQFENQKFLKDIGATWYGLANNYLLSYKSLLF